MASKHPVNAVSTRSKRGWGIILSTRLGGRRQGRHRSELPGMVVSVGIQGPRGDDVRHGTRL